MDQRTSTTTTESKSKKTWRAILPVHPATELFSMMSESELRELGEDIKANGLKSPIIIWSPEAKGRTRPRLHLLLDGRNRLDAMELVGLDTVDDGRLYLDPTVEAAADRQLYQVDIRPR
jgi:ParB-like chromosome segregation protein Spo0J